MCIAKIRRWFVKIKNGSNRKTKTVIEQVIIPYPEEPPNFAQTVENINIDVAIDKWMIDYKVPEKRRTFWKSKISITIDPDLNNPAQAEDRNGERHITIKPEYVNSGVIAHEQAHNSYALLTDKERKEFLKTYTPLKESDALIVHLYKTNSYGLTNDIEGHAELYRYLNEHMPEELKQYYPKLLV